MIYFNDIIRFMLVHIILCTYRFLLEYVIGNFLPQQTEVTRASVYILRYIILSMRKSREKCSRYYLWKSNCSIFVIFFWRYYIKCYIYIFNDIVYISPLFSLLEQYIYLYIIPQYIYISDRSQYFKDFYYMI